MTHYYLGIDLGGTNVKAGLVDGHGKLIDHVSLPTAKRESDLTQDKVVAQIVAAGKQAIAQAGVAESQVIAVGLLSPGQADLRRGIVLRAANFPKWRNVHLRDKVSAAFGLPAILENDANAAAYGEWWVGCGRSAKAGPLENFFMFTLGTGVGGGLVYQGEVVRGAFDFATEVGHMIIEPGGEKCGCGQHGCVERYCSAKYSALRTQRKLEESRKLRKKSTLGKVLKKAGTISSADVAAAAEAGDPFAVEAWEETCRYIALACINVCHFIDPQVIALGGGMSKAGRFLLDGVKKQLAQEWWAMTPVKVKLILAKLGNDAGIIGAAGVAKQAHDKGVLK